MGGLDFRQLWLHSRCDARKRLDEGGISCCLPSVTTAKQGRCPSWSSNKCSFTAPLLRRNCAQSKTDTHRAITVASKLSSLFLKRNFRCFFPAALAATC